MHQEHWIFHITDESIQVTPPDRIRNAVSDPLSDLIFAEIRTPADLDIYRRNWTAMLADPEGAKEGMAGNGSCQSVDGDDVILESLYEQYEPARISIGEFERFLDEYAQFLRKQHSN